MTCGTTTQNIQCERNVWICADFPAYWYLLTFLSSIADILHLQPSNTVCENCSKLPSQIWTSVMTLEKKQDQCAVVQFCFLLGYSPTQTYTLMKTPYGTNVLCHVTIFHWHEFYVVRRALAAILLRNGRPKTSSTEIMVNMIETIIIKDQSLIDRELGAMLVNICTYFFSSMKFDTVNSNRFYAICCSTASLLLFWVKLGLPMYKVCPVSFATMLRKHRTRSAISMKLGKVHQ